MTFAGTEFCE